MRIFTAEIKRLLKTRSVLILILAALLLAPALAYFPASFETWTYRDGVERKRNVIQYRAFQNAKMRSYLLNGTHSRCFNT